MKFSIEFVGSPVGEGSSTTKAIDCSALWVDTVNATVYDSSRSPIATGGPWDCIAHSGTMTVPEGTNLILFVEGIDPSGIILYQGEMTGITISDGQTTDAGAVTVIANYEDGAEVNSFITGGGTPWGLAHDGTYLWLGDYSAKTIYKLDPPSGSIINSFASPGSGPADLAHDGTYLWSIDWAGEVIYNLDPADGSVITSFPTPATDARGLAHDGTYLWCATASSDAANSTIYKLDPNDGSVITSFPIAGNYPSGLAHDGIYLWHSDSETRTTYMLDPSDGSLLGTFLGPTASPYGLAHNGIYLWIADSDDDMVYQVYASVSSSGTNTAPVALITSPVDGSSYDEIESITFIGTGLDTEDGALTGSSLVWSSSIDGQFGTGTTVSTNTLAAGAHTITLTVTDSGSLVRSDTISITVDSNTPLSDLWSFKTSMPTARYSLHSGVINGKIYVVAGTTLTDELTTLEAYDPASDSWETLSSLPTIDGGNDGRYAGAAGVMNGLLYLAGGWRRSPALPTSSLQIYDPSSDSWTTGASMPVLSACSAGAVVDGKLYVYTACDGYSGIRQYLHSYDPTVDSWTELTQAPYAYYIGCAAAVNERVYFIGGSDGSSEVSTVMEYEPTADSWAVMTSMTTARASLTCSVIDNKIYAIGGSDAGGGILDTVEVYDPSVDSWTSATSMPTPRSAATGGVVDGKAYVIGGYDGSDAVDTVEEYY